MNIGILTYHRACNYGAFLQARALCNRLNQEKDITAELIDFRMCKEAYYYSLKKWRFRRIIRRFPAYLFQRALFNAFDRGFREDTSKLSKEFLQSDSIEEFQAFVQNKYDVIVAGSDEIWKTDRYRGFPTPYWLFGDLGCRKFSYAASARADFSKLTYENQEKLKQAVNDFEFVGVRDQPTFDEISKVLKEKSRLFLCCDPSFLYDFPIASNTLPVLLQNKVKLNPSRKNVLLMTENKDVAQHIYKKLKGKYNLLSVFEWHYGYCNIADLSPLEWLQAIAGADLVITSYFHAVCFSIMKNTPFIALGTPIRSSKTKSLLCGSELENNYISDALYTLPKINLYSLTEQTIGAVDYRHFILKQQQTFIPFLKALRGGE